MEILNLFGVDWKLLVAQLVNFIIVVVVLWWFALKPLTRTMKSRNQEIAKGLSDAKASAEKLSQVEQEVKDKLQQVKTEAGLILDKAKNQADQNKQVIIDKTKQEVENLIQKAKQQIDNEKKMMVDSAKKELAQVVTTALEKILTSAVTKDIDKKYIDKVLKDLK